MICVGILCLGFIGMYFTIVPGHPYLALSMRPFVGIGEIGFWILVGSMRADVCDYDEYVSGKRREGLIAAAGNWVNKLSISFALIFGGFVLEHVVQFNNKFDIQDKLTVHGSDHVARVNLEHIDINPEGLTLGDSMLPTSHNIQLKADGKLELLSGSRWIWQQAINPKGGESDENFRPASQNVIRPTTWAISEKKGFPLQQSVAITWVNGKPVPSEALLEVMLPEGTQLRSPKPKMPVQKEGAMTRLLMAYTLFPCVSLILAFVFLLKYPLSREKLKIIRKELESRRGVID
jgi:hypothetical protein